MIKLDGGRVCKSGKLALVSTQVGYENRHDRVFVRCVLGK